jgi:hypothetical protein
MVLLEELGEAEVWLPLLVRFEMALLEEVGLASICRAVRPLAPPLN